MCILGDVLKDMHLYISQFKLADWCWQAQFLCILGELKTKLLLQRTEIFPGDTQNEKTGFALPYLNLVDKFAYFCQERQYL